MEFGFDTFISPLSGNITVKNITGGYEFEMKLDVSGLQRQMLICGGRLNQIKEGL